MSVNQTLDAQGFWTAQQAAFSLQHLGHAQVREARLRAKSRPAQPEVS
jgi:hypothetical protein